MLRNLMDVDRSVRRRCERLSLSRSKKVFVAPRRVIIPVRFTWEFLIVTDQEYRLNWLSFQWVRDDSLLCGHSIVTLIRCLSASHQFYLSRLVRILICEIALPFSTVDESEGVDCMIDWRVSILKALVCKLFCSSFSGYEKVFDKFSWRMWSDIKT